MERNEPIRLVGPPLLIAKREEDEHHRATKAIIIDIAVQKAGSSNGVGDSVSPHVKVGTHRLFPCVRRFLSITHVPNAACLFGFYLWNPGKSGAPLPAASLCFARIVRTISRMELVPPCLGMGRHVPLPRAVASPFERPSGGLRAGPIATRRNRSWRPGAAPTGACSRAIAGPAPKP